MTWTQVYDPFGHWWLSALVASLPIIVLFALLAGLRVKPHWAALAGAATAVCAWLGARVFRVHNVPAARAALTAVTELRRSGRTQRT